MSPQDALQVLRQLGALESLKLNLGEHATVQNALTVLDGVVNPKAPALKVVPTEEKETDVPF